MPRLVPLKAVFIGTVTDKRRLGLSGPAGHTPRKAPVSGKLPAGAQWKVRHSAEVSVRARFAGWQDQAGSARGDRKADRGTGKHTGRPHAPPGDPREEPAGHAAINRTGFRRVPEAGTLLDVPNDDRAHAGDDRKRCKSNPDRSSKTFINVHSPVHQNRE